MIPRPVLLLAATELWERFTYYGMRALLVLCLTAPVAGGGFGRSDADATAIYGLFAAGVYLSALPGGWLADRWLGAVRCIWVGGLLITAGNLLLAAAPTLPLFAGGLVCIASGVGLLKPNVTTLVARASAEAGAPLDGAFTVFYVGINIGGMAGPLVSAALAAATGWRGGFVAAAAGMLVGLATFRRIASRFPDPPRVSSGRAPAAALVVVATALLCLALVPPVILSRAAFAAVIGAMIVAFATLFRVAASQQERANVRLLLVLLCGATLFWMAGEQAGTALTLFAERLTDRRIGSWQFPAAWYQALYPLYVILLAPAFVWLWQRLTTTGREPVSRTKFGAGLLFAAAGLALAAAGALRATSALLSPMWLAGTYLLLSIGELCLGPAGLAAGTRLAPRGREGMATGLWFLSLSLGGLLAGLTGGIFDLGTAAGLGRACGAVALILAIAGIAFLVGRRLPPAAARSS